MDHSNPFNFIQSHPGPEADSVSNVDWKRAQCTMGEEVIFQHVWKVKNYKNMKVFGINIISLKFGKLSLL